jgi:hypothetical protein
MPILGTSSSRGGGTPTAPTSVSATAGNAQAVVSFTASSYRGKSGSVTYTAISSPGNITASGTSPITVTGLTNGTAYTFTVRATSSTGETATSSASGSITPVNPVPVVTGGTLSSDATYYYRTFTGNGTLSVSASSLTADVMLIAGAGCGSSGYYLSAADAGEAYNARYAGGGGGAGGLLYLSSYSLTPGDKTVTIGAGATGGNASGNFSYFDGNRATRGGSGLNPGGSGGGGPARHLANGTLSGFSGSSGTSGEGNAGGNGSASGQYQLYGGGGGGAGGNGSAASSSGGAGGSGTNAYSSWATATGTGINGYFASGGGGGSSGQNAAGGATNGGGAGGSAATGSAGTANTGSGGGGGGYVSVSTFGLNYGGNGGSGICIVRYLRSAVGG